MFKWLCEDALYRVQLFDILGQQLGLGKYVTLGNTDILPLLHKYLLPGPTDILSYVMMMVTDALVPNRPQTTSKQHAEYVPWISVFSY